MAIILQCFKLNDAQVLNVLFSTYVTSDKSNETINFIHYVVL